MLWYCKHGCIINIWIYLHFDTGCHGLSVIKWHEFTFIFDLFSKKLSQIRLLSTTNGDWSPKFFIVIKFVWNCWLKDFSSFWYSKLYAQLFGMSLDSSISSASVDGFPLMCGTFWWTWKIVAFPRMRWFLLQQDCFHFSLDVQNKAWQYHGFYVVIVVTVDVEHLFTILLNI